MSDTINVLVSSKSEQKTLPVKHAFHTYFTDKLINVIGVGAQSHINEQPIGHEETRTGALNRIKDAKQQVPEYDYVVSIESGLVNTADKRFDFAHIIIEDKEGTQQETISQMVQFPTEAVEEAKARGFDTVTAGKVMAERNLVSNHADPHSSLTHAITNRTLLIKHALLIALGQADYDSRTP